MSNGKFVISLDFELMWGVRDSRTINSYGNNIRAVHEIIPKLISEFNKFDVKATFSVVGFLFAENKNELEEACPSLKPLYHNNNLSPYNGYFNELGENSSLDPYHYAPKLITEIKNHPQHEIGTHTFSHYYCLEPGQTIKDFREDLVCAISIAKKYGVKLTSLVFPRNQFNDDYLKVCNELGILIYRGNEHSWLYKAKNKEDESSLRRAFRLLDAYINISGHNTYTDEYMKTKIPFDVPSSRFLRPYSKKLNFLDGLRLNRIVTGMTHAAKNNETYHLWWHPHNFGNYQNENFLFLNEILVHYKKLHDEFGFKSVTMTELAILLKDN